MKDLGKVHEWTGPTGVKFRDERAESGAYYHDTTPKGVVTVLESAMRDRQRIRVFTGDSKTGECWHDEFHVNGTVGRSMGPHKIPLLIETSRSYGGAGILTDCIVRILAKELHGGKGFYEAYRHPKYKVPEIVVTELPANEVQDGLLCKATIDGKEHARFKSVAKAERWAAFMRGERFGK